MPWGICWVNEWSDFLGLLGWSVSQQNSETMGSHDPLCPMAVLLEAPRMRIPPGTSWVLTCGHSGGHRLLGHPGAISNGSASLASHSAGQDFLLSSHGHRVCWRGQKELLFLTHLKPTSLCSSQPWDQTCRGKSWSWVLEESSGRVFIAFNDLIPTATC